MKTRQIAPILLLISLISTGCATVETLPAEYSTPTAMPREIVERFCYEPTAVNEELVLRKEKSDFRVYNVRIDSGLPEFEDDSPVTLEYYRLRGDEPAPVVLVLPILNGQKDLVRPFATHFAKNGYAAVIVNTVQRKTLLEDLVNPEAAIRQTVLRHRRVIDWIETRPELDASRIGVFGASLGGFNALYLAALDARVGAVAPALVAGDLPYVLVNSTERRIVEAVEGARATLDMDDAELSEYLRDNIETDTLSVAPHLDARKVLMVLAKFDDAVPYEKQLELRDVIGRPQAISLPTGHIQTAVYLFYVRSQVRKFFDRVLDAEATAAVLPEDACRETTS